MKVKNRAKNTLSQFQRENAIKQNEIKANKEKEIMNRKQLMRSSLQKENMDAEDVNILRRLQKLENAEKSLKKLIERKKELSNSEASIEKNAQKLFWPKILVSKQEFLHSSSPSVNSHKKVAQIEDKIDSKVNQMNIKRDASVQTDINEKRVDSNEYNAISIATQLYERLKSRQMTGSHHKNDNKVYRNVAVSTTPPSTPIDNKIDSNSIPEFSLSSETSYLSLPPVQQFSSNKATIALSDLYKNQLLNKRSNSVDSKSSASTINLDSNSLHNVDDNTLDPLIARINNLKELINEKVQESARSNSVAQKPYQNQSDVLLSRGDRDRIGSNSQLINRLSLIRESESDDISNSDESPKVSSFSSVNEKFREKECLREDNADDYSEECSTSSASFKTLHAFSSSGRSSPFLDLVSQQSDHQESNNDQTLSNPKLQELASSLDMDSIASSFLNSEPIRDRNAFWKEVFERAGIDVDVKQIENFLQTHQFESEASIDSFSISTFSKSISSHSTPK